MKRAIAILIIALCTATSAYAFYSVSDKGEWKDWPKELEPLRKQSRTLVGPQFDHRHYAIPFAKREEFEAAWPHFLSVKSKGAAIILVSGESFFLGDKVKAGLVVHSPPEGQAKNPKTPEAPVASENPRMRYGYMTYIELVVDGDIVDLNRIPLPPDTPIVDERFKEAKK